MISRQYDWGMRYQRFFMAAGIFVCLIAGATKNLTCIHTMPAKSDHIRIVYIANQGYLIEVSDKKVLIDALHLGVSPELMATMTSEEPPFDNVNIILATQSHADHFSPDLVAKYMDKNLGTIFLSSDEAASHLRAYIHDFASASQRIKAVYPMDGEKIKEAVFGVNIQVMNFPINQNSYITSLGFLVKVGGKKFLHIGDSAGSLDYLKDYKLSKEKIDVAFIPYWYFTNPDLHSAVKEGIKAKHVIPMYFGLKEESKDRVTKILKSEFPQAILLLNELDSKTIQ